MPGVFDKKIFNNEVFQAYMERLPKSRTNELLKSKAIVLRPDLKQAMSDQVGGNIMTMPIKGLVGGDALNYDGSTNITADSTKTYSHTRVVVGRAKAWTEKDFSYDITGGEDFMANIAEQVGGYWEDVDQDTLLAIIQGIFAMTGTGNKDFVEKHTANICMEGEGKVGVTTLNSAMQKALGQNKGKFALAIMHSTVSTNLENLNVLQYLKYTDANGVQRDLGLATWNGRIVIIDDGMPAKDIARGYVPVVEGYPGALKVVESGATEGQLNKASVTPVIAGYTPKANDYVVMKEARTEYTTYVLGEGAFELTDCGAKVPSEVDRDPSKNGGEDTLYTRQRKCFAPRGISFTNTSMATASPSLAELKMGTNWTLVKSMGEDIDFIDHKAIPIAQIISLG